MAANDLTGLYFGRPQTPSQPDVMRHPDQKLQPRFHVAQRQATERSGGHALPQATTSGDALFPLARFKNMYRSPFMCAEEKRKRLHWLEREEQQYLARSYPWHRAQGDDLLRYHLAAIVIQSEFRAWRARQLLRALRHKAQLRREGELARQRQSAVRLLRQQAKDLLLTLYAQGQYGKTRDRLMVAKGGVSSGPSLEDLRIDVRLWETVQQLGLDPVEVLAGQMTSKQIKLVLNASSIRNSGMLPQRVDLGLRREGSNRLLNAQDSFLSGGALPMASMASSTAPLHRLSEGLGEMFPPCVLSATMEPERLSSTMREARACLPLLASTTSLDGLDWVGGAAAASARAPTPAPPPSSRAARRSHPSSLRQPSPTPQQQLRPYRSSADHLLWRCGTGPLPSSAGIGGMMHMGSNPLHQHHPPLQAEAPPSPKVVQQLHEYHRQPKAARPGILKLTTGHMHSPSPSPVHSPERAPEPAPPSGSWVLCSTGVVGVNPGVNPAMQARDLSASADGPLLGRSGRRTASRAGRGLQSQHSDGDLFAVAGKAMSRTCRLSESGAYFNLPRLPAYKQ